MSNESGSSRNNGHETDGRDSKGRFTSGNPGRPKGARHKVSRAVEELLQGEAEALTRKAIGLALEGDTTALRLCFERILPPRKDTPVRFRIEGECETNLSALASAVVQEVAHGEMTPGEGTTVMKLLEVRSSICEIDELTTRIASIEARISSGRDQEY